jgi:hypothetical protein
MMPNPNILTGPLNDSQQYMPTNSWEATTLHDVSRGKGGIGWSVLRGLEVEAPGGKEFKLRECLREQEVLSTWESLQKGKKVMWEGDEGVGKSTFLSEVTSFLDFQNTLRSASEQLYLVRLDKLMISTRERIENALDLPNDKNIVYLFDSADYLWEKVEGEGMTGPITQLRINLLNKILHSTPC